ncbi:S9 family peptidase [Idiomarina loihiensis]|uniref:Protease II n=1 Tax=Idiomarina loihiensis (strain ATCC BAA-735 / DSM 15497 / L2-TR) TaxID=283942 RepID=Q5QZZ6_IDILO|nr:oligopeptidase B [Idiomarina loihiensis]AAV80917.1 Protease II [Idiomarina loihiensis L2TR]AGM34941.1 oligopeptidase B [Idiomarina loihiensis GSL 199]
MQKLRPLYIALLSAALLQACSPANQNTDTSSSTSKQGVEAPVAEKVPHEMTIHGDTRIDNYYWMRDDERKDPKVLAYLEAENAYTDEMLAHTEDLQQKLFEEMKSRIAKDDNSVPVRDGDYYYSTEMRGDNEYPIYVRSTDFSGTNKQILLNVNELAEGKDYYSVGSLEVSPDDAILAYSEDTVSRRMYEIKLKNMKTGELLPDQIKNTSGDIVWGNDGQHFYYIKKDPETLLGYQVYRHKVGTEQQQDELVYEEQDTTFYTGIRKSKDDSKIYIIHDATESKGVSLIDANDPNAKPVEFVPREDGLEYSIAKHGDDYYVLTNLDAVNFRLMRVSADKLGDKQHWQEVIPHKEDTRLEDIELFDQHLVYKQRQRGLTEVFVRNLNTGDEQELSFRDKAYTLYFYGNKEADNPELRLYYTSMTTPGSHYNVDLNSLDKTLLKQQPVLGDFKPENYASERLFVTARDGAEVPVTLVYRKDKFKKDGANPLYQYGYGSYGSTSEPSFSSNRLSLLDRGFVFAIAHIRGSQMLGRTWYEDGKKLSKKNTFNDFVDVTKSLVEQGYGAEDKVFAMGGSAGGLLMGAVINQAPELYLGVAAHVPFVDVVTTMLDESIPLTTNEFDEWGNPKEKVYYDYMLSYSPYDQISAQDYPNLLVTTGLFDSQVQYFEPAKWVAKLRDYKTDDNLLLFKTEMEAGHGGVSGRFKRLQNTALEYAFFLDLLKNQ